MIEFSSNWSKDIKLQTKEVEQNLNKAIPKKQKKKILYHIIIKLVKSKEEETILKAAKEK